MDIFSWLFDWFSFEWFSFSFKWPSSFFMAKVSSSGTIFFTYGYQLSSYVNLFVQVFPSADAVSFGIAITF